MIARERSAVDRARRSLAALLAGAIVAIVPGVGQAFQARVRSNTILQGQDRPALVIVPGFEVRQIKLELTAGDLRVKRTHGAAGARDEIVFEWDQGVGKRDYTGELTVIDGSGTESFMELTFSITVTGALEVQVPRDKVDLDAHTLEVIMSRPAGKVEITVIDDTGAVVDAREIPFAGEPPGTPLPCRWEQGDQTVIRIDVRGFDQQDFWAGVELSPWWVEIPHEEIVFDTGKYDVRTDQAPKVDHSYQLIDEAVQKYGHLVQVNLYVVGYTDTQGSPASNRTLSENRARSIARELKRRGFSGQVYYQGFGEDILAVPTPDETDEERNRRAVYILAAEMPPISPGIPEQNWKQL